MTTAPLTELVDEIRERKLSRNRHFKLMSRPPYRAAMRLKRYLDGLAEELRSGTGSIGSAELRASLHRLEPGRVMLRLIRPRIQAERRCYLSDEELQCLYRHHPDVRTLIEQGDR